MIDDRQKLFISIVKAGMSLQELHLALMPVKLNNYVMKLPPICGRNQTFFILHLKKDCRVLES